MLEMLHVGTAFLHFYHQVLALFAQRIGFVGGHNELCGVMIIQPVWEIDCWMNERARELVRHADASHVFALEP